MQNFINKIPKCDLSLTKPKMWNHFLYQKLRNLINETWNCENSLKKPENAKIHFWNNEV